MPEVEGDKPVRKKFARYPIGYFHVDIAEVRTEEGKLYLFVAIDRTRMKAMEAGSFQQCGACIVFAGNSCAQRTLRLLFHAKK